MENMKNDETYVKALCVMISRGDILSIEMLNKYLKHVDFNKDIRVTSTELNMLLGVDTSDISPKYYMGEKGFNYNYTPIDLILYSCVCNDIYYSQKYKMLEDILKFDGIEFSSIRKVLEHSVSKGDLKLFKLLNTLDINYNATYDALRDGTPYSILDNCLSLALARLTINGKDVANNYPGEILDYFLSLDSNSIDFDKLKSSLIIYKVIKEEDKVEINDVKTLFEKIEALVSNYKHRY